MCTVAADTAVLTEDIVAGEKHLPQVPQAFHMFMAIQRQSKCSQSSILYLYSAKIAERGSSITRTRPVIMIIMIELNLFLRQKGIQ